MEVTWVLCSAQARAKHVHQKWIHQIPRRMKALFPGSGAPCRLSEVCNLKHPSYFISTLLALYFQNKKWLHLNVLRFASCVTVGIGDGHRFGSVERSERWENLDNRQINDCTSSPQREYHGFLKMHFLLCLWIPIVVWKTSLVQYLPQ